MAEEASNESEAIPREYAIRQYHLLKSGVLAMLVLGCAVPLALNCVDPDLWGHWKYGQDWMADGDLPRTASHTYAAKDYPWINHENIAELLFAIGFDRLGVYPMLILKCLGGMAMLATMAWTAAKRDVQALAVWALLLLVANNLQAFFPMRPQLLSFAIMTAVLFCTDRAFQVWPEGRQIRFAWLWALPPLFALWVNSHGGFVAGLCIVGALLLGRMIGLLFHEGTASLQRQCQLIAIGLACLAATVVNPYGLDMHRWLLESLGSPRPEITEWAPPTPNLPVFWPFITLAVVGLASLVATKRRRDWTQVLILALVAWQASLHLRHIAFFAILCGFWLPVHFQSALARLRPERKDSLSLVLPGWRLRAAMAVAILVAVCCQGYVLASRLTNLSVQRDSYPVDAVQYIVDRGLHGRLVVAFNWAQYAIAALSPDVEVGFDGRFRTCYPQEVVDMHFDFLLGEYDGNRHRSVLSGPLDGGKVLRFKQPDLVLNDRGYEHAVAVMEEHGSGPAAEWVLLYRDPYADLWGRKSRFGDPSGDQYVPPELRRIEVTPSAESVPWPALPTRDEWLAGQHDRCEADDCCNNARPGRSCPADTAPKR